MLTFAVALKDKGVPVPEIAKKLTIKTGKNAGKSPSVASLYQALAEAEEAAADDGLPLRPKPVRIRRPEDPLTQRRSTSANGSRPSPTRTPRPAARSYDRSKRQRLYRVPQGRTPLQGVGAVLVVDDGSQLLVLEPLRIGPELSHALDERCPCRMRLELSGVLPEGDREVSHT